MSKEWPMANDYAPKLFLRQAENVLLNEEVSRTSGTSSIWPRRTERGR